jgi:phage tail-like protein
MAKFDRPLGKFRFKVEIDGLTLAHFQSISGLQHEIEALEFKEGGVNDRMHKLPGQGRYPNLVLKVGYVNSQMLEGWHMGFTQNPGGVRRKNGSIILCDDAGEPVTRWNFFQAWPVKWEGPQLDSSGTDILVETVEIAHHGISRMG